MLAFVRLIPRNFYWCFRHETCNSEVCSKIAKFWAKTMSHEHRSGDVNNVQRRSRFALKGHSRWRIMSVCLWYWNQSPIIPMEASRRTNTEKSTSSSVNVMDLNTVFFDCHKIVWSIRNTTLKVCTDCAKQFVRNAQKCGKNQTHQLIYRCLCVSFWPKTKP